MDSMPQRLTTLAVIATLLVACGGGGSGSSSPATGGSGGTPPAGGTPGGGTPGGGSGGSAPPPVTPADDGPVALVRSLGKKLGNPEAVIPAQCYTATDNVANPCYSCHVVSRAGGRNWKDDWELQTEYAFSDVGLTNHWTNLFVDRRDQMAAISDAEALAWIREDNYTPLREALARIDDFAGWKPDLDFTAGFDDEGFARDGTAWRAFRYKPFLGTFFPTNGNTDDVLVRLPEPFRTDADGNPSREIYKINLAIVEAAVSIPPGVPAEELRRRVEPIDESLAGFDLDGDGVLNGLVDELVGLPPHYVGGAANVPVQYLLYPQGIEFLHTVRYVDPEAPGMLATRMKEVRYSRRREYPDLNAIQQAYERSLDEKDRGLLPHYAGSGETGLLNDFGWQLSGFIEDAEGALRNQTYEETWFCMGCHSSIGATVDQTFALPRKVPGAEGWGHQDPTGIPDVPQYFLAGPEYLDYFRRVRGADEFRENREIREKFFTNPSASDADLVLDEAKVLRAAPGGDQDITWLIFPSYARALELNKAYMALVQAQADDPELFTRGRDTVLAPARNVHREIDEETPDLSGDTGSLVQAFSGLWLDWDWQPPATP